MGRGLIHLWQHLSFFKRLAIECPVAIVIMLLVEVLFSGKSGSFVSAVLQGALLGLLFTIIDHAAVTRNRRNESGDETK
jgi:hypothetical protein